MRPQSIGLIVNPHAGRGAAYNLDAARRLVQALGVARVVTGPGLFGQEAAPDADIAAVTATKGRAVSQAVASAALQSGVDALVVIGGDGTMADVAMTVSRAAVRCPILGVGAGSINAGALVTCRAAQVDELKAADFAIRSVDALDAGCNGESLALAFNDIVIGTTIVGTVGGDFCDLDANAFFGGAQVPGEPMAVGVESARVVKRGKTGTVDVAFGAAVGTVVAAFAQCDAFWGKAIIGGVGLSSLAGAPAGCIVCDQPLVRTRLDLDAHRRTEPIRSAFVSLSAGETVEVTGLAHPAMLCADGNPLKALQPEDVAFMRVRPAVVDMLHPVRND